MKKIIRVFTAFAAAVCAVIMGIVTVGSYTMPDEITRYGGESPKLGAVYSYSVTEASKTVNMQRGASRVEMIKAFNMIPVKRVRVVTEQAGEVYVSGEAFGIKLYTDGVIVIGTQSVDLGNGERINPAKEAGIETGDIVVSVNNTRVYSASEVTAALNDNNGRDYSIKVKRDGRYRSFTLTPAYSVREGCYKAGMWVRDSTAGIGTVTFYNEKNGTFAALGHQINDSDTNELMPLLEGEAVSAEVTKVERSTVGTAGSLWCEFGDFTIGSLIDNSEYGLYGKYTAVSRNAKKYPIASKTEVEKGSAQLISTVSGKTPQAYDIEITRISYNKSDEQKDIVFKITDKSLLGVTGGIVQGMSGSPIVQNGKLVGAVTHVIVNNPEKGYAVFAQTMYEKSSEY